MALKVLIILGLSWAGYAAALAAVFAWIRYGRKPWIASLLLPVLLMAVYAYARIGLIPYAADNDRRCLLLAGDEPLYLLTAVSLAHEGDLDIADNIERGDYRLFQKRPIDGGDFDFFNTLSEGRLSEHRAEWESRRYMQHRPGISAFLAPVFRVVEGHYRWWAYFLISGVMTLFGLLAWGVSCRQGMDRGVAFVACVTGLLSPPVLFYANQVYPEAVAGCLLAGAALLIGAGRRMVWLAVPALMMVVWFSDRALPIFATLAVAVVIALPTRRQRLAATGLFAATLILFGLYCQHRFGIPVPVQHNRMYDCNPILIPVRLFQIFFDNKQGWVWLFPTVLLLPVVLGTFLRQRPVPVLPLLIMMGVLLNLALVASFGDWRGGTNPRGRYYVIPQLLMIPLLLHWFKMGAPSSRRTKLFWLIGLGALGLVPLPWLISHPSWWFRSYHPFFGWEPIQRAYACLPSLPDQTSWREWLKLLAWAPVLMIPAVACIRADLKENEHVIRGAKDPDLF